MLSVAMAIQLITDLCVQIHHHTWVVRHEWLLPVVALLLLLSVVQGPIHRIISGKAKHDVARSVVCVTGCDSGFGLYMSRKMKELGYIVVSTCLTPAGAAALHALRDGLFPRHRG